MKILSKIAALFFLLSVAARAQIPVITTAPSGPDEPLPATYSIAPLTVTATNAVSYQWLKDGVAIPGAINPSLALGSLRLTDAGSYSVRVSNAFGSVTSSPPAVVRVSIPHVIQQNLSNIFWGRADYLDFALSPGVIYVSVPGSNGIARVAGATGGIAYGGTQGTENGIGNAARFNGPTGLAIDRTAGILYVSDTGNDVIRKVTISNSEVSNVAGRAGFFGLIDGTGNTAVFNHPTGLALAPNGTLYVCDTENHSIRMINVATSTVTTLAGGGPTQPGTANGVGTGARFRSPYGLSLDAAGANLYVADTGNHTIRKINLATRAVTTVAGTAGSGGFRDGAALTALFAGPKGVAIENATGDIFVADTGNGALRKISASGIVSLLAGGVGGLTDTGGVGANAIFSSPVAIQSLTDAPGSVAFSNLGRFGSFGRVSTAYPANPQIVSQPQAQTVTAGGTISFTVEILGSPQTVQWQRNGVPLIDSGSISGSTQSTLTITRAQLNDGGNYTAIITNAYGTVTTLPVTLTVTGAISRLANLSVRAAAGTGDQTLIVGFASAGTGSKQLLIRAVGPGLAQFGVGGVLADPQLSLYSGSTQIQQNNDWGGGTVLVNAFTAVGAFGLPAASKDAALYVPLAAGSYSAQAGSTAGTGVVLVEAYDADTDTPPTRLVNLSARNFVGTGDGILIVGFVITGNSPKTLLIRGVGPTLATFGVGGVLVDPQLQFFRGATLLAENDNWGGTAALTTAFTQVGAFGLPAGSRDAALTATLEPGSYTVQLSGVAATTGVALVEVYEVL